MKNKAITVLFIFFIMLVANMLLFKLEIMGIKSMVVFNILSGCGFAIPYAIDTYYELKK